MRNVSKYLCSLFCLVLCLLLLLLCAHARTQSARGAHTRTPNNVAFCYVQVPSGRGRGRERLSSFRNQNLPLIQSHAAATYVTPDGHRTGSLKKGFGEASHCGQLLRRIAGKIVDFLMEVDIARIVAPRRRCHRGQRVAVRVRLVIVRHAQCCVADLQIGMVMCLLLLCHLSDMFHDTPLGHLHALLCLSYVFSTFSLCLMPSAVVSLPLHRSLGTKRVARSAD